MLRDPRMSSLDPWGSVLALHCGFSVRPVGHCVSGPSPGCAIVTFVNWVPSCNPGHSRGRRREGSTKLFAVVSFSRSCSGAPLRPAPFSRRGCGLPVDFLGPCGAFTESRRPLTFPSSLAGTPESESDIRPICCPRSRSSRMRDAGLNLRARGTLLRPAGESKTGKSPRTPFIVSRTCEPKPTGRTAGYF